jgi:hypothetical protein
MEEVFGKNSRYYASIKALPWKYKGTVLLDAARLSQKGMEKATAQYDQSAFLKSLDMAEGLLLAAEEQLRQVDNIASVYEGKNTGPEASLILNVINLSERKLRKAVLHPPSKEKDIQDIFETLLIGADIPYSRENDSIEYSSKTYIPDFTIQRAELAIEIKLSNREGREKEIIAEINDDILAYRTRYANLLFVVYDCGFIRDVERFASNFEENHAIVRVVKQ